MWGALAIAASRISTPKMTGRRFHRTTEMIPHRPWKAKSPFASRPIKISINKGTRGVRARYDAVLLPFISIVRSPGRPVILVPEDYTQLIPQEFSGVTDVKFITPINSLRIFWCKRLCNFSQQGQDRVVIFSWELRLLNPQS